jgi:hypothetical protein
VQFGREGSECSHVGFVEPDQLVLVIVLYKPWARRGSKKLTDKFHTVHRKSESIISELDKEVEFCMK